MSVIAALITGNSNVCFRQLVQADIQEDINDLHHLSFMTGINQWHVVSPNKISVMPKVIL